MVHLAVVFERMRYEGVTKVKSDLITLPTKAQRKCVGDFRRKTLRLPKGSAFSSTVKHRAM